MPQILCSKSNEFVYFKNGFYYIGITDIFLKYIGNILSASFPRVGEFYSKGEIFGFVEAKILACELYMPITCKIEEINDKIQNNPSVLDDLSLEDSWLVKVSSEFFDKDKNDLIDYETYKNQNI